MSYSSTMEIAARIWVKQFQEAPIFTTIITLVMASVMGFGIYHLDKADKEKRELTRLKNLEYETQIDQLETTEKNIKELLQFIDHQKSSLRNTQDTILELKQEQEKLKPLVESDKKIVDAIFKAQEERNSANIWRERWIGFGVGILASLIASFIWFVAKVGITNASNGRS